MREYKIANDADADGMQVYHYGMERCESGHYFGPAVRDHFLIHFILGGHGIFKVGDKVYSLHENQAFLITPGEVTYYEADMENPWAYCWIGFNGARAYQVLKDAGLTAGQPILNYDSGCLIPEIMGEIMNIDTNKAGGSLKLKAGLYMVLSELQRTGFGQINTLKANNYRGTYVDKAIDFILRNYSRDISVSDIVEFVGLNRSYFCSVFKESLNVSPRDFLISFRMKKAADLLSTTPLSIGDIARSTGYNDPLCFSKTFKRVMGVSPLNYRNLNQDT